MKKVLTVLLLLTIISCKGWFGLVGYLLSPARDLTGTWRGTSNQYTISEGGPGTAVCWYFTGTFEASLEQDGNNVTGSMTVSVTSYRNGACSFPPVMGYNSYVSGTVSSTRLSLRDDCSYYADHRGPTQFEFVFTTDNMEGTATEVTAPGCQSGLTSTTNAIKLFRQD